MVRYCYTPYLVTHLQRSKEDLIDIIAKAATPAQWSTAQHTFATKNT